MSIKNAEESDAGAYSCVISNSAGEDKTEAKLVVEPKVSAPEFSSKLQNQEITESQPLQLQVKVSGEPFPEVEWLKDGKPLSENGRIHIETNPATGTATLRIDGTTLDDAGQYTCRLKNPGGTVESKAKIDVKPKEVAPTFKKGLTSQSGAEGDQVKLEAEVEGKPKSVKWYKGNQELKPDGKRIKAIFDEKTGKISLVIGSAEVGDTGDYKLVIGNDAGTADTSANLTIEGQFCCKKRPKILKKGLKFEKRPKI